MKHVHKWLLEPCLQSRPTTLDSSEVDGELYTVRNTRGNTRGDCKCGARRTFHPFNLGIPLAAPGAPVGDPMTRMLGALV